MIQFNQRNTLILYYMTLGLFVVGSFAASWRLWGFNYGAFLPEGISVILLLIVLVAPGLLDRLQSKESDFERRLKTFWLSSFSVTFLLTLLFALMRTRTHFLGDGYTALSLLEVDDPLLKMREMGESYAHLWIKDLFGSGKDAALASFRLISIGSGVISVLLFLWAGSRLYGRSAKALFFGLLMLSGGYALLFFGYVENYSLFMLTVIAVVLSGILATRNRTPKWLPLVLALVATLMHTIGVVLIPAALFVALRDTPPGQFFARSKARLIVLLLALATVITAVAVWFYQSNQFARFSLLTLSANQFTLDGYTLFSFAHVADILNLLFLLSPSLLIGIWLIFSARAILKSSFTYQFLGLAFVSALIAVFVFDPKLGMPRDWDLFSFVGVPLVATVALLILESGGTRKKQIATLILLLNFSVLVGRLTIINMEEPAIAQFSSYLDLDSGKSRPGSYVLYRYYQENGRRVSADSVQQLWKDRYPEIYMMDTVTVEMRRGDFASAAEKLERILKLTPTNHDALSNLGTCYTYLRKYDTALILLNQAIGHNPYNLGAWTNLGTIYFQQKDYAKAERNWLKVYQMDSLSFTAPGNLAMLYRKTGQREKCLKFFRKAAAAKDAPPNIYAKMAEFFLDEQDFERAAGLYRFGLQRGLDSSVVKEARTKYHAIDSIMSES